MSLCQQTLTEVRPLRFTQYVTAVSVMPIVWQICIEQVVHNVSIARCMPMVWFFRGMDQASVSVRGVPFGKARLPPSRCFDACTYFAAQRELRPPGTELSPEKCSSA